MTRNRLYILLFVACVVGYVWVYLGLSGSPSVQVCLIKNATDIPCPSCGSTRSVVSIAEGHFAKAFGFNPLGYIIAMIMLVTPPWLLLDVLRKKESLFHCYKRAEVVLRNPWYAIPLAGGVIVNWIWNISKGL